MKAPAPVGPGPLLRALIRVAGRLLPAEARDEIALDLCDDYRRARERGVSRAAAGWRLCRDVLLAERVRLYVAARRLRRSRSAVEGGWPNSRSVSPPPGGRLTMRGTSRGFEILHAARVLRRSHGFTVLAVLTIGVGVGAAAAVSGVVSSVLVRPLPYANADRLVTAWQADPAAGALQINASAPLFRRWDARARSLDAVAAYRGPGWTMITGGDAPQRVPSVRVTTNMFDALGVAPALGRDFQADDAREAEGGAVIISHGLWQRLGGTAAVLGSGISLDEEPHVVVGVMPAGFELLERGVEVWHPYDPPASDSWDQWTLKVVARLAPGAAVGAAGAELARLHDALLAEMPGLDVPPTVRVRSLLDQVVGGVRGGLVATLAAVLLALVMTTVNVGGLLLVRTRARAHELAVMEALGAGRRGVVGHVLHQSVLLGVAGLATGLVVAHLLVAMARRALPADFPRGAELSVDGLGLAAALGAAVLAAAGAAVLAIPRVEHRLGATLRRAAGGRRGLRWILVGQTALSVVLLVAGGLTVRSFLRVAGTDPGIDPSGAFVVELRLPPSVAGDDAAVRAFVERVDEGVAALPGVESVGQVQRLPFAGGNWNSYVLDPDAPDREPLAEADVRVSSPGYLAAVGLPLVAGRGWEGGDRADGRRVALVNEPFAAEMWPGSDPLGRRVVIDMFGDWEAEVVGVVAPVRHHGLTQTPRPEVYVPYAQMTVSFSTLVVRAPLTAELVEGIRGVVGSAQPAASVSRVSDLAALVSGSVAPERMHAFVFGALALLALTLSGVGMFGLASYSVGRELRESGVRAALGASSGRLYIRTFAGVAHPMLLGLLVGSSASVVLTRGLTGLLHGVTPTDPATYITVAAVLALAGVASTLGPARRAARVDPLVAMRDSG